MKAKEEIARRKEESKRLIDVYNRQLKGKAYQITDLDIASSSDVILNLLFDCIRIIGYAGSETSQRYTAYAIEKEIDGDEMLSAYVGGKRMANLIFSIAIEKAKQFKCKNTNAELWNLKEETFIFLEKLNQDVGYGWTEDEMITAAKWASEKVIKVMDEVKEILDKITEDELERAKKVFDAIPAIFNVSEVFYQALRSKVEERKGIDFNILSYRGIKIISNVELKLDEYIACDKDNKKLFIGRWGDK